MDSAQGKRILIVDDANLVRLYYADAFRRAGFQVYEAANGLEALERLVVTPADLLIIDVNMPKMDGVTFLKALRQHEPEIASIPALMISTANRAADFEQAYAAGANFYLVKPVAQDLLVAYALMLCGVPA